MIREKLIQDIKRKLRQNILLLVFILLSGSVLALSDPINQSLTEYNNLTRADNFLEIAQEMNVWVDGMFGISFLVVIFGISFVVALMFRNDFSKAFLFGMFIETTSAIFLFVVDFVPDEAVFFSVPLLILSVIVAVASK